MTFDMDSRDDGGDFGGGTRRGRRSGSKFARFGRTKRVVVPEEPLDYKNVAYLGRLISPTGKILSRRRTGFSGQDQRKLAEAVKRARMMALLPFVGRS
jgi:small subunit ribosomal protein S18